MPRRPRTLYSASAGWLAIAAALMMNACGGGGSEGGASTPTTPPPGQSVPVGDAIALTASGKLVSFNRATPANLVGSVSVSGLGANETLLGIDFRPVDGKLYAVSSGGRTYVLDPSTGVATFKAALGPAIGDNLPFARLDGTRFAVGFNPATDRLRVVSNTGQNLHLNVDNGSTVTDTPINGVPATVAALAHTNALPGAVSTRLYNIDGATGTLYLQETPNDGTLSAPVPLGVGATAVGGFNIDAVQNIAYAALTIGGVEQLYTVPLAAGTPARNLGTIGIGEPLLGLALAQPTVVRVVALNAGGRTLSLFDAAAPNIITASLSIAGLGSGESVLGIDYRPANGQLYGLTSSARVVTLDTTTGTATVVSALAADTSDDTGPYASLSGTHFSVDFDPVEDRLRVISDTGANLRINVATGAVVTDTEINGDTGTGPRVVIAAAHGHSFSGATSTVLYDLVTNNDVVASQTPPRDGALIDIGPLGFYVSQGAAMDIAGGDDGLLLVAAPIVEGAPWVLYSLSLKVNETGRGDLYRNPDRENYVASMIGGAQGPAIMDIALKL